MSVEIGKPAPSFRLPSGQGPEVGTDDFRGKNHLVVWFTKGMACPFCRHQMSQIARGYPAFRERNAEVLEVTETPPEKAKSYLRSFPVSFPYLCDPDFSVHRSWGLDKRPHSLAWKVKRFIEGARGPAPPPSEFGKPVPWFGELASIVADTDRGFFVVDRTGVVRYKLAGGYDGRQLPSNDEILAELERCETAAS